MKIKKIAVTSALALLTLAAPLLAAQLTDQDKQFLGSYEKVRHALVADDLSGAQKAAADLGTSGSEVAPASRSMKRAGRSRR